MKPGDLHRSIAASVDASPALLPVFDALFAGIDALGSTPRRIVNSLRRAGVEAGDRVLDLACGKGAVSVRIASALGCRVLGVDGCRAFIGSARELARGQQVEHLCEFREGSVEQFARSSRGRFDAVLMIGLWHCERAAPVLRKLTWRGGVYIIDDAVASTPADGTTIADVRRLIESLGDDVLEGTVMPRLAVRTLNARLYATLRSNAHRLARLEPRKRGALRSFLKRQRAANILLDGVLRPVILVARRGT